MALLILGLKLYRKIARFLSPTSSCRFSPSCSEFAICALKEYGVVVGLKKSLWRVLRCQGFSRGGYDPVK